MSYEIGKYYKVPCAKIVNEFGKAHYIPVIGPRHSDPQFGTDAEHYHIDARFTSNYINKALRITSGFTNRPIWVDDNNYIYGTRYAFKRVVQKERKCRSTVTGLLGPTLLHYLYVDRYEKYRTWAESFLGKKCHGGRCPHRNIKLIQAAGIRFCPLHGLKANANGEIDGYYSPAMQEIQEWKRGI
ncbi:hypothetical protein QMN07_17860 [Leptospira santarosai]|uniref:hypothetical protein n=1 Tax=Leptospira santarosai TaxID=28183 RepID=UPI0024AF2863|nr:hypothetical protein [Leptospira santarosai]MDI7219361.1 hypothetical protein [Leptospira santarosai]